MTKPGRWRSALVVSALVVSTPLTGGCADDASTGGLAEPAPTSTSTAPSAATSSAAPWAALPGLGRCGPQPQRLAGVRFRRSTLRGQGRVLPALWAGHGRTAVVLVHQTDGGGLCGWLDFAARIAGVPGRTALVFDLCGYGDSDCPEGNTDPGPQVQQVRMAIDAARRSGAQRIVLVGASMGGSLAVLTAAVDRRVDAVVDLSGPDEWRGAVVHRRAGDVRVPLLVAMAEDEGPAEVAAARATAGAALHGTFVSADHGHGYELLLDAAERPTPIAERVLAWIAGR